MQWLIWPDVGHMNSNPEWLMPPMGKQDVSPYDILIDLVPWYVSCDRAGNALYLLLIGLMYVSFCISVLESSRSVLWSAPSELLGHMRIILAITGILRQAIHA